MDERRASPRVGISFPVECKTLPSREYFYTVCKDLSMIGIKIISNDFIPKDSFLKLHVNLVDSVVELKAKLVWCNKERCSDRYSAGLQFVEVNERGKETLSLFLDKVFAT